MMASRDAYARAEDRLGRVLAAARTKLAGNPLVLAMVLVGTYLYILREPSVITAPVFWAEDGTVFFKGAIEHGLDAILMPYNGQLFVFQRIMAALAAPLSVSIQPAVYAIVAIATAVFSCSIALSSRWRLSVPLTARFICVLALLCSPAVDEVFGSLLNAHWWLAIGLVLLGMLSDPLSRRLKFGEIAFSAVAALSGLGAMFALPTLAVRWLRNRSRHSLALLGVALAGGLVQVGYLLNSGRLANGTGMFMQPKTDLLVLVKRVFVGPVLGDTNMATLWPGDRLPDTWVWLIPIVLVVALAAVWIRAPRLELAALLLVLVEGWLLALRAEPDPGMVLSYFGRYFLVPIGMLYVTLIVSWPKDTFRRAMAGVACVLLASGILSDYHLAPLPAVNWAPFAACMDKGTATCSTVIPPGWTLEVTQPGR